MGASPFGRYEVVRELGSGGFGTVFLARDPLLDAPVALKVLSASWSARPEVRARFLREARLLRRVRSQHVATVHDLGETPDGRPYLVMDFAEGGTLADRLVARGRHGITGCTPAEAAVVVRSLGSGLGDLHAVDVLHRDVKPANLLLLGAGPPPAPSDPPGPLVRPGERVVLADFGLAKDLGAGPQATIIGGTPGYMPVEQATGQDLTPAADVYAASVLVLEMLTGEVDLEALHRLPPVVADALRPGLSGDPAARPSARDWSARLGWALGQVATAAAPAPAAPVVAPRRRRQVATVLAAVLAAVLLAIGAAGAFAAFGRDRSTAAGVPPAQASSPALSIRIDGPERVPITRRSTWRAVVDGTAVELYWTDWNGRRVEGPALWIEPTRAGVIRFTLTAVDEDGRRLVAGRQVTIEG